MVIKFHLEDWVKVKLTNHGMGLLKQYHDESEVGLPFDLKLDKNGYYEIQLWDLIKIFGSRGLMSRFGMPFESDIILLGKKE